MMVVYIGIDWREKKHDVVFLNEAGAVLGQLTMSYTPDGLANLEKTRQYLGLEQAECLTGLETAHNLVIDFLWAQGYPQIYVIPPSVIKRCRGRYGNSQARTDQHDSRLIADGLGTHHVIVELIAATTTQTGLQVHSHLDERLYATSRRVSEQQLANVNLDPDPWHGEWNYTIRPYPQIV